MPPHPTFAPQHPACHPRELPIAGRQCLLVQPIMVQIMAIVGHAGPAVATQWQQIAFRYVRTADQDVIHRGTIGGDPMHERNPIAVPHLDTRRLQCRVVGWLGHRAVGPELHHRTSIPQCLDKCLHGA